MATISFDAQWLNMANRALLRIGNTTITSFDDGDEVSKYCLILLPQAIETVMVAYTWRGGIKRAQLAPLADAPEYGYDYQYALPSSFARLIDASVTDADGNDVEWILEGKVILTDGVSVNISYVAVPTAPEDVTPAVRDLIVKQLAYLLSIPVLNNSTVTGMLLSEYNTSLSIAMNRDPVAQYIDLNPVSYFDEDR